MPFLAIPFHKVSKYYYFKLLCIHFYLVVQLQTRKKTMHINHCESLFLVFIYLCYTYILYIRIIFLNDFNPTILIINLEPNEYLILCFQSLKMNYKTA